MLVAALATPGRAGADVCVSVDVHFTGRAPSPGLVRSMQEEASSIWGTYGVRVQWGPQPVPAECERSAGPFDVTVERQLAPWILKTGQPVLGSTRVPPAAINHTPIHIDYDATERLLRSVTDERLAALAGNHQVGWLEIGRALGRILAHEIGHVLLGAPSHQVRGLMRSSFAPADLLRLERQSFTLSQGEQIRLRNREQTFRLIADGSPINPNGLGVGR